MRHHHLAGVVCAVAVLVAAAARAEDKTYKPDDEGYIKNWLFLEPIALDEKASEHNEDSQKAFFEKEYIPSQKSATPKDGEKAKVGEKELAWKATEAGDAVYKFDPPQDNSLYLAVTYINSENDVPEAVVSIGSDDSSLWRVNGEEVVRVYAGRAVEKDQDKSKPFTLKKGTNVLSAAVINGGGETGLSARFLNKDGTPIKNITISLTPPAK